VPSVFSHAVAGLSLGVCFARPETPRFLLALGAACAVLPDLDVTGLAVGFGLDHPLGHRGFSHSILCAGLVATALAAVVRAYRPTALGAARLWWYFFAATLSHGLLDAMTNGGRGVAFLAPFSDRRYHFAFRPIEVSPISVREFFTERGATIMANELVWIWLPCLLVAAVALWLRRRSTQPSSWSARHS
jgi:inner membrane protein